MLRAGRLPRKLASQKLPMLKEPAEEFKIVDLRRSLASIQRGIVRILHEILPEAFEVERVIVAGGNLLFVHRKSFPSSRDVDSIAFPNRSSAATQRCRTAASLMFSRSAISPCARPSKLRH